MAKLTEWEAAMLQKLVGDEMVRAREVCLSAQPEGEKRITERII